MDMASPEAQERLGRLFRYSQVGACVNSVTHDVNNFLGAILAYADLLQLSPNQPPEAKRMLEQISKAVGQSSALVSALTSIARKEKPDASMVDIRQVLNEAVMLREYDFRTAQIALQCAPDENLPSVMIDVPRVKMALIYLLNNAFEAVQGTPDARVRITAAQSHDAIEIAVWNSGEPVPEQDRARMFEPFFTTKDPAHLGLGLALAIETAQYHDGTLTYDPERGFLLSLPLSSPLMRLA